MIETALAFFILAAQLETARRIGKLSSCEHKNCTNYEVVKL